MQIESSRPGLLCTPQGGIGPMQGQANHFVRYAPEQIEYGIKRYTNETKRLYGCIEKHLASGREWLAADQYTIADMANYAWIAWHDWAGAQHLLLTWPHSNPGVYWSVHAVACARHRCNDIQCCTIV